jgi:hypothetical protein
MADKIRWERQQASIYWGVIGIEQKFCIVGGFYFNQAGWILSDKIQGKWQEHSQRYNNLKAAQAAAEKMVDER